MIGARDRFQPAGSVGDEHTGELGIDIPLGQHPGTRGLKSRLNTGETSEPDEVEAAAAKGCDRCCVVADRHVLHRNIKLITQLIREGVVKTVELFRVLIRDCPNPERGCVSPRSR